MISQSSTSLALQVGASNELPESEELDALYDRFLIRRSVAQVSSSQIGNLARLAAGTRLITESSGNGSNGAGPSAEQPLAGPELDLEDFRWAFTMRSKHVYSVTNDD